MTKLLSIAIPSYNSEAYMRHAIESLLPGGDEVEILVVDDGSKDGTAAIADEYEARYPGIVRALHKENGGHGDAVMCGLHHATGIYFKVVDSDDWVDPECFNRVLARLREALDLEWWRFLEWDEHRQCVRCLPAYTHNARLDKKYHLNLKRKAS